MRRKIALHHPAWVRKIGSSMHGIASGLTSSANPGAFFVVQATALEVGQWTARVMLVLLPLIALAWCWSIARRPGVNRKCVFSLMFVLGAWLAGALLSVAEPLAKTERATLLLKSGVGVAVLALLLIGLVIGMLGLMECQDRRRARERGPGFATVALLLAGLSVTLVLAAGPGLFSIPVHLFETKIRTGEPGPPIAVDEFNFRMRTPGTPWVRTETSALHPGSKLAFTRKTPDMALAVVADKLGAGFNTDQLLEVGKGNARKHLKSGRMLLEKPEVLNGLEGIRVETRGLSGNNDVLCVQWYCFTNGFGYQLISQGPWRSRKQVAEEAGRLFALFEVIDSNRTTEEAGLSFPTNYVSRHYGYRVDVANSGWRQWRALQREFSWFEFAARQESGVYLAVVPAWLGEDIEDEAVRGAMLTTMGIEYPDPMLTERKPVNLPRVSGVQFDFERQIYDVPYRYRLRILHGNGYAWLLAVWMEKHKPDYDPVFDEALRRVTFEPPSGTAPDTGTFTQPEKAARALVLNRAGAYYYREGKFAQARALFAESYSIAPQPLAFENTLMAWSHLDQPADALAFVEKELAKYPKSAALRGFQALFQGRAGKRAEAVATYAKLFAEGAKNPEWFNDYIRLLVALERYDDALSAVRAELKSGDITDLRLLEAGIYREKKDFPEAIRLLKTLREKTPFVADVGHALAVAYLEAGEYENARNIAVEMLKTGQGGWPTHVIKGRSEAALNRYDEAKTSFETALRLAPNEPEIKKGLEVVSAMLGEGSNSAVKQPIAPVPLPDSLLNSPLKPVPENYGKEYGAYYSRRITALQFDRDGSSKRTDFGQVKVLDASGAAAFSTVTIPFDPLNQEIFVNTVRVIESSGTVVTGKVSRFYVTDALGSELVTHQKILNVPISGLSPGSTLEFTVTVQEAGGAEESPFVELAFSRAFPVRQSIVFLAGESLALKSRASPGIETQKTREGLYWVCDDPPVGRREPLQPAATEFLPMLWLGTGSPQWPTLASRYLNSITNKMTLDPALRSLAQGLTGDLTTAADKVTVLARHVQTNYTYKALEFGRRGRIPDLPSEMAQNKYGDCKDHALMLQQMLEAAGVPARLALVNSQSEVQKSLPSLDQFDHMLVFVPGQGTNAFLDCTQKGARVGSGPPHGLEGHDALILDQTNPRFEKIPDGPALAGSIQSERRITIVNQEDAAVQETVTFTDAQASALRGNLMEMPAAARRIFLQSELGEGKAELGEWSIEELENPAAPLKIKLGYTVRRQFHRTEGRLVGSLPALLERSYLTYEQLEKRLSPVEIKYPLQFNSRIALTVPEGFSAASSPNPDQNLDERFLTAHRHEEVSGAELRLDFAFQQKPGKFSAQDYAALREAHAQALTLVETRVTLQSK